jgi:hypothetical protein
MKRILIFCALLGAGGLACHAQTLEVMAEQLAALRTLQQSTTQGLSDHDQTGSTVSGRSPMANINCIRPISVRWLRSVRR